MATTDFDQVRFNEINACLSSEDGLRFDQLDEIVKEVLENRSPDDLKDYRLGRKGWKKFREEVMIVYQHFQCRSLGNQRLSFPLNDHAPDCWLIAEDGTKIGIEVTRVLARSDYYMMKELNESKDGFARGFSEMQDNAPKKRFDDTFSKEREPYSTELALDAIRKGTLYCLDKKDNSKYDGMVLLLGADLTSLRSEQWDAVITELSTRSERLPFSMIYLVGRTDEGSRSIALKGATTFSP